MSSFYLLRKTIFLNVSRQSLRSYTNVYKYQIQNLCTVANVKAHSDALPKARNSDYFESKQNRAESDSFGTLDTPLEDKFRRKSRISTMPEKKIIKIKKPKSAESDEFGTLSEEKSIWYPDIHEESKFDNDLSDDSVLVKNLSKRFRCPYRYLDEMKSLVQQKKVRDALDLFVDMKRNFVAPIHAHYTYMIGVCGKVGYTEMAFKLLKKMTEKSFTPTPATLTGLFNSCAESPYPDYGLKKALFLKEKIVIKKWKLGQVTYHAMIKAFGKCGDLQTAFEIVDEMAAEKIKISAATYNFLLMSCVSNKEAGFTYAVEVWRKMKAKKCLPDIYTCNLLLRATRDCEAGPEEISCLLLQHWSSYSKRPYGFVTKQKLQEKPILKLNSGLDNTTESIENNENEEYQAVEADSKSLNESFKENANENELQHASSTSIETSSHSPSASVLLTRPVNGPEILEIKNLKTPNDRLSLFGGIEGFLKFMSESKVRPDTKTFSFLLDCLPDNIEDEEKLLLLLDKYKIKPYIGFFNNLIKRRNFRKENQAAKDVVSLINKYDLTPDIMTYGALALGCRTLRMASTFIAEMKKMGVYANTEIVGCLIRQASMILDFSYMKYVLNLMYEQEISPNEKMLSVVENALRNARKNIILIEHGKEVDKFYQRENLQADFKEFSEFYEKWLKRMKFQAEEDPWSQFKTDLVDRYKGEQFIQS